jgi:hypothetical protein
MAGLRIVSLFAIFCIAVVQFTFIEGSFRLARRSFRESKRDIADPLLESSNFVWRRLARRGVKRDTVDPLMDPNNPDRCFGPAIQACQAKPETRYYYDSNTKTCKSFTWNGCDKRMNNWFYKNNCIMTCIDKKNVGIASDDTYDNHNPRRCFGAHVLSCDANNLQYHYNAVTNACEEFTWGGCNRQMNNWDSKSNCEIRCVKPPDCPAVQCTKHCKHTGFKSDANGCQTCECDTACV